MVVQFITSCKHVSKKNERNVETLKIVVTDLYRIFLHWVIVFAGGR